MAWVASGDAEAPEHGLKGKGDSQRSSTERIHTILSILPMYTDNNIYVYIPAKYGAFGSGVPLCFYVLPAFLPSLPG